ncbi:polyprenyl synthetase family protein [Kribbella sp. NPDC051587]|uniref:polyprenyl synthetase family protein n=1 Tax=Kribbella sp. NPDC051587 TaxID=3364119 RepID=UPI0037B8EA57
MARKRLALGGLIGAAGGPTDVRALAATGAPTAGTERALIVVRYKSAKYTIERPLHIGVVFGGADTALLDAFTAYALPLGEAFQLRDDLLGAFGNPRKPANRVSTTSVLANTRHSSPSALGATELSPRPPGPHRGAGLPNPRRALRHGARECIENLIECQLRSSGYPPDHP